MKDVPANLQERFNKLSASGQSAIKRFLYLMEIEAEVAQMISVEEKIDQNPER